MSGSRSSSLPETGLARISQWVEEKNERIPPPLGFLPVPPAGTGRKGCKLSTAFVQVEATFSFGV